MVSNARWGSLAVVLFVGCGHSAPGRAPASARPPDHQVVVLGNAPPEVVGVWAVYGVVLDATAEKTGHNDFAVEVGAREQLAEAWKNRRASRPVKDPYLDLLADVLDAGLMREYVLAYLSRPGWTVASADLAKLDFEKWERWQSSHLPRDHRAITPVMVTGSRAPAVPGSHLPGAEIDPVHSSCQAVRAALDDAAAAWDREESALPSPALSIQIQSQAEPAVKLAAKSPRARRDGLILVSPRVLEVLFIAGFCAVDRGDWRAAEALLRRAIALSPASANVRAELVQTLIMQKRLDQADAELDAALQLPDTACHKALLWRKRGYILFDRGQLVDSYRAYAHSLDFDAGSALARSEMNLILKTLRAAGTYDEKVLAPLVRSAPPSQMLVTSCPPQ